MRKNVTQLIAVLIGLALPLAGCKKQATAAPVPAPSLAVVPAAAQVSAPAPARAEQPSAAAPTAAPSANGHPDAGKNSFDLNSVALTTKALPPFPYLGWPEGVEKATHSEDEFAFDRVYVIAGTELRPVEGRVNKREYTLQAGKLSQLAAERNYESAMKDIGATLVNQVQPFDPAFMDAHKDFELDSAKGQQKLGISSRSPKYSSYLLRTPATNIWIVISIDDISVSLIAVEEKPMVQSVKPLSAAASSF